MGGGGSTIVLMWRSEDNLESSHGKQCYAKIYPCQFRILTSWRVSLNTFPLTCGNPTVFTMTNTELRAAAMVSPHSRAEPTGGDLQGSSSGYTKHCSCCSFVSIILECFDFITLKVISVIFLSSRTVCHHIK